MPRRKPDLPHLYVGFTEVSLDDRRADLKAGAGPKELVGMHMQFRQGLLETTEDFEKNHLSSS